MKRFQLKNIAIFILVLANVYLSGLLFQRYQQRSQAQERATQEVLTLCQAQGVNFDAALLSWEAPLQQLELRPDTNLYQSMAQSLLGEDATALQSDNGATVYQGQQGTIAFYPNGTMDANGQLSQGDAQTAISAFCHTYGYDNTVAILEDNTGTITANATYRGMTVSQTSMTFTVEQGVLTAMTGTVLPQTHSLTGATAKVDCLSALSRFLSTRRTTGAVVSIVNDVEACYSLTPTPSSPLTLLPIWRIATDNGTYWVDGGTGNVTYR